jgi:hypothetical protein
MSIKIKEIDSIKVDRWHILIRGIKEEGSFHRWVLTPDMDISDQEQKVQDIANAAWTPEVKTAYETFKAEQAARMTP